MFGCDGKYSLFCQRIANDAKGRAEERKEMARKMKALGLSAELIMQTTGLSAEDTAGL